MNMDTLKILIVEDEALIAEGLACCVKRLGHSVVAQLDNGYDALKAIERNDVDCVLIDINLPDMDGVVTVEKIHRIKDIPCIFITGYSDYETILRAGKAGAYGYLKKPVDEVDLNGAIKVATLRHLDKRSLNDQMNQMKQELDLSRKMLEERKLIEQAKGILAQKFFFDEEQTMKFLRKKSRDNNRKLVDVAREIIKMDKLVDL